MDINASNLRDIFTAVSTAFNKQFEATETFYKTISMVVKSTSDSNSYPRLDDLPGMREWIDDRIIHKLSAQDYTIKNKTFETTIGIPRENVEDDQLGFFNDVVKHFAQGAASFPDSLVFPLFKNGDKKLCYDGQYFFDTDHRGYNSEGGETSVSNIIKGDKPAWYLIDDSKVLKPMIFQDRRQFKLVKKDSETDDNTFQKNQLVYGIDGRCNAGFGLWQLAHKASIELNSENYEKARIAMTTIRKRNGEVIDIRPTKLLVPSHLEGQARKLLQTDYIDGGNSNIWKGTAEVVVIPQLG